MVTRSKPLPAKLTPPRIKNRLDRGRLFANLRESAQSVWIYGPPGSGKSTLAASFLAQQKIPLLWMQLDSDDVEPTTFFHFLTVAKDATTRRRADLPAIEIDTRANWTRYARHFARALFAALPPGTALVFDDVHKAAGVIDEILAVFIAECPDSLRIFLLSHHAPPAPYVDALARRQLQVVLPTTMRFERAEISELLQILGHPAGAGLDALMVSTQGWAAGLVMLAGQSAIGSDAPALGASREHLLQYISRHVLAWIPQRTRHIAQCCAFFPDFDAALACAASGDPHARELISQLHRDGFFIEERGTARTNRYAWHSLVAEALRDQAGLPGSESRQQAEADAGRLLLRADQPEAGISLLLSAAAFDDAAIALVSTAAAMIASGRDEQLTKWIELLPDAWLQRNPWLMYWRAVATTAFDENSALNAFDASYHQFMAADDRYGMALSASGALAAIDTGGQSFRGIDEWMIRLTAAFSDDIIFTDAAAELRILTGALFGYTRVGRLPPALVNWSERLQELIVAVDDASLCLHAATVALDALNGKRDYEAAVMLANFVESHVDKRRATAGRLTFWLLNCARLFQAAGDARANPEWLTRAEHYRRDTASMAERYSLTIMQIVMGHVEAAAAIAAGNAAAAKQALEKIASLLTSRQIWWLAWQHHGRAKLDLLLQRPADALENMRKVFDYAHQAGAPVHIFLPYHFTMALCLLGLQRYDEARLQIDAGIALSPKAQDIRFQILRRFADALKSLDELSAVAAVEETAAANAAAAVDVVLRDFVLHLPNAGHMWALARPWLARICAESLHRGIETELICRLVSERKLLPPPHFPPSCAPSSWPWPVKIEALGGFRVLIYNQPLKLDGKAQHKPLDLLKLLVARAVSSSIAPGSSGLSTASSSALPSTDITEIINELWPDLEAKDPKASFDVALHRLRKLLTVDSAITIADGRVSLAPELVWCDAIQFARASGAAGNTNVSASTQALRDYTGPLFGDKQVADWAFSARERLANQFVKRVSLQGEALETAGNYRDAIEVYERGIVQDNLIDPFYRGLMRCHLARGESAEALRVYRRCREILSVVLGVEPSAETRELRASII